MASSSQPIRTLPQLVPSPVFPSPWFWSVSTEACTLSDPGCALVWASGRGDRRDDGWEEGMRALAQFVAPRVGPAVFHERRELVGASATGVTRSLRALEKWSSPQQQMFAISFHMGWNLLSRPDGMLGSQGLGKHCWSRLGPRWGGGPSTPWPSWASQARARPLPGMSTTFQVLLPAQQQGELGLVPSGWGSAACVASG